jgi:hypothetical protein
MSSGSPIQSRSPQGLDQRRGGRVGPDNTLVDGQEGRRTGSLQQPTATAPATAVAAPGASPMATVEVTGLQAVSMIARSLTGSGWRTKRHKATTPFAELEIRPSQASSNLGAATPRGPPRQRSGPALRVCVGDGPFVHRREQAVPPGPSRMKQWTPASVGRRKGRHH